MGNIFGFVSSVEKSIGSVDTLQRQGKVLKNAATGAAKGIGNLFKKGVSNPFTGASVGNSAKKFMNGFGKGLRDPRRKSVYSTDLFGRTSTSLAGFAGSIAAHKFKQNQGKQNKGKINKKSEEQQPPPLEKVYNYSSKKNNSLQPPPLEKVYNYSSKKNNSLQPPPLEKVYNNSSKKNNSLQPLLQLENKKGGGNKKKSSKKENNLSEDKKKTSKK